MSDHTATIKDVSKWEQLPIKKKEVYSADEIIDAYVTGKKDGANEIKRAAISALHRNIEKSGEIATHLFHNIQGLGINISSAYLKINSIANLKVLVSVPENDFLEEKFLEVYSVTDAHEREAASKDFKLRFSFIGTDKPLNEKYVISDGFILRGKF